jgi:hypothetical protein
VFKEYDVQKRCIGLGMEFGDVRDLRCEGTTNKHKNMIIARNENSPREKGPSLTHRANHTYGGAKK